MAKFVVVRKSFELKTPEPGTASILVSRQSIDIAVSGKTCVQVLKLKPAETQG